MRLWATPTDNDNFWGKRTCFFMCDRRAFTHLGAPKHWMPSQSKHTAPSFFVPHQSQLWHTHKYRWAGCGIAEWHRYAGAYLQPTPGPCCRIQHSPIRRERKGVLKAERLKHLQRQIQRFKRGHHFVMTGTVSSQYQIWLQRSNAFGHHVQIFAPSPDGDNIPQWNDHQHHQPIVST